MDIRDKIIIDNAPVIAEPRYGERWPMPTNSHRFMAAEDGLWVEVHRTWLYLLHQVAVTEIPLPYGAIEPARTFIFSRESMLAIITMFISDAREELPNEAAAWAVWDTRDGRLHYRPLEPDHTSPGGITFKRPVLDTHESLAIDLHSHGDMDAFWSATDDADDTGEVKLSVVVGEVTDSKPSILIRLCALGLFIDLDSPL